MAGYAPAYIVSDLVRQMIAFEEMEHLRVWSPVSKVD